MNYPGQVRARLIRCPRVVAVTGGLQHAARPRVIVRAVDRDTLFAQIQSIGSSVEFARAAALLFALLNPFLLSIYLLDLITDLRAAMFLRVLVRGALISTVVFILFALGGERIFSEYLQVRFESFQVFGGVVFLLIGVRFVFMGAEAIRSMRGDPQHLAGSIAMPFMIGPGTVSASVVIGAQLPALPAAAAIALAVASSIVLVSGLKIAHDVVKERNARLIDRYVEVVGRVSALLIGTIAVDMILEGLGGWLIQLQGAVPNE